MNNADVAPVIADIFATAGIPAIALHIPQPGAVYFGPDNFRAGWTAGTALAEYASSRWRSRFDVMLLMNIPQGGPALRSRMTGVLSALEHAMGAVPAAKVVRLDSHNSREESRYTVVSCLRKLAGTCRLLISAVSDDNALAAMDAVREMGLSKNCAIVGHDGTADALRAIAEPGSPFVGTVAFFPDQYGHQLTDLAASILRGDRVPPAVHVPHQLITRGNFKHFVQPDGTSRPGSVRAQRLRPRPNPPRQTGQPRSSRNVTVCFSATSVTRAAGKWALSGSGRGRIRPAKPASPAHRGT